jgi:hypothetical protein
MVVVGDQLVAERGTHPDRQRQLVLARLDPREPVRGQPTAETRGRVEVVLSDIDIHRVRERLDEMQLLRDVDGHGPSMNTS